MLPLCQVCLLHEVNSLIYARADIDGIIYKFLLILFLMHVACFHLFYVFFCIYCYYTFAVVVHIKALHRFIASCEYG